jgi:putative membrane protein
VTDGVAAWYWPAWAALMLGAALLAADRARALGHRVDQHWLSARSGSWEQRRYCIATAGIIGWTVHQSWFQRRAGLVTVVACVGAGSGGYAAVDMAAAEVAPFVRAASGSWAATLHRS